MYTIIYFINLFERMPGFELVALNPPLITLTVELINYISPLFAAPHPHMLHPIATFYSHSLKNSFWRQFKSLKMLLTYVWWSQPSCDQPQCSAMGYTRPSPLRISLGYFLGHTILTCGGASRPGTSPSGQLWGRPGQTSPLRISRNPRS